MTAVDNHVSSVLTGRTLVVLGPDQTVREAAVLLGHHRIGGAPVLDGGRLVGVFTERDVLERVVAVGGDADALRVCEVMTREPRTVTPATALVTAFAMMTEGNYRHLPVVDGGGSVVAMLSMRDIPPEHRIMHRQWREWTNGQPAPQARA